MAKTKTEPTVTFANEPPTWERIMETLYKLFLEQEGYNVTSIKAEPSPNEKNIIILEDKDSNMKYTITQGEGVECEKLYQ